MEETIERIPKTPKTLDPLKNRSHYDAVIDQIDDEGWMNARQIHSTRIQTADEDDQIIHRSYFDALREILQQMNEHDFLSEIGVNTAHLFLSVKLCTPEEEVFIRPETIYDTNWVSH